MIVHSIYTQCRHDLDADRASGPYQCLRQCLGAGEESQGEPNHLASVGQVMPLIDDSCL